MNTPPPSKPDPEAEKRAGQRFIVLNLVRIGSLVTVMAGIAGAQNALPIPYLLSVALALGGFVGFFFGPYTLAKHFKADDARNGR